MPSRSTDVEYWRERAQRKVRDILLAYGGKMSWEDLLRELQLEGYDVYLLAPLLPKFPILVFDDDTVSLRYHKRKPSTPQPNHEQGLEVFL